MKIKDMHDWWCLEVCDNGRGSVDVPSIYIGIDEGDKTVGCVGLTITDARKLRRKLSLLIKELGDEDDK
jgi:hypothetical protein